MNFLAPFGLLGLAALAPIIALYFLKLKREERVVPSTLLWKKMIDDLQVNAPFQRLKYSLLLLLQLVAVALLAFALARPALSSAGYAGRKIVLLVDTSASMSTRDAGKDGTLTRLAAAVEDAKQKVDGLHGGDEMSIIAFDRDARQLAKSSRDRAELARILATLETRDMETKPGEAFETALALIEGHPDAEVLLLSDGCFGPVKLFSERDGQLQGNLEDRAAKDADANRRQILRRKLASFHFVSYGSDVSENAGITQIDARSRPVKMVDSGGKRVDAMETQVFVMVENFSPKARDVLLSLATEAQTFPPKLIGLKGRPERQETLSGAAVEGHTAEAARSVEVFKLPLETRGVVTARILSPRDKFPADDTASVVVGGSAQMSVLLVTEGNYFLQKALAAMPGVSLTTLAPSAFLKEWEQSGRRSVESYDACVFDSVAPGVWPQGGALFLGQLPPLPGFVKDEKPLEWPEIVDWDRAHPVMRYVNFGNVTIAKAQAWKAPKAARVLVEGNGAPLAVAIENDQVRVVGVAFELLASDWAYRPSLPLFLRNAIPWLADASPRRHPAAQQTGEALAIPAGLGAKTATLLRPGGAIENLELATDHATFVKGTEKAGVYRLKGLPNDEERVYAFNLASRNESDNAARGALSAGEVNVAATRTAIEARREIWRHLALAALGLLLLEWWVFHRRVGM